MKGRKYRIAYLEDDEDPMGGSYRRKTREFRSLRDAAEFCLCLLGDPDRDFQAIHSVEVDKINESEALMFSFFTDGKVTLEH